MPRPRKPTAREKIELAIITYLDDGALLLAYKTGFDRAIVSAINKAIAAGHPLLAAQIGIEEYPPYMVEEMKESTDGT